MKTYEIVEHTADVGLKAFGKTLAEAYENVAKGMFDLITDNSEVESVGQYDIVLEAPDLEQLLVDWLSELLFLNTSKSLVFGFFKIELDGKNKKLSAHVFGDKFTPTKYKIGVEIKAVTYHMLKVKNKKPYEVQVLFDI
jgi:SHS2 domain-containing protein